MNTYTIVPMDERTSRQVRTTLTDPIYGSAVPVTVAGSDSYGPCRSCLNTFSSGDHRILFLYNPFSVEQEADFAGPVYIHAERCERYSQSAVFPAPIRRLPIILKGYDAQKHFVAEELPTGGEVEAAIARLFQRPEVAFIHVRNTEAKCFIMHIARGQDSAEA